MINSPARVVIVAMCSLVACAAGCGGDGAREFGGADSGATGGATGGAAAGGGRTGTGGQAVGGNGGNPGSAGHGSGGSSGATGSGGRGGAGGRAGTGGTTGSGGTIGSGGTTGSGATTGSGGTIGSGGTTGSGATTGSGGSGGANPVVCDQIAADYQVEMPNAKTCSTVIGTPQCQIAVSRSLGCGANCLTYVQDSSRLDEILARWKAAGCDSIARICPLIACMAPQRGQCALGMTGRLPSCQDGLVATD